MCNRIPSSKYIVAPEQSPSDEDHSATQSSRCGNTTVAQIVVLTWDQAGTASSSWLVASSAVSAEPTAARGRMPTHVTRITSAIALSMRIDSAILYRLKSPIQPSYSYGTRTSYDDETLAHIVNPGGRFF